MEKIGNRVLLTGFEPFHTFRINSSWEAARAVGAEAGKLVQAECLPVDHQAAQERLYSLLVEYRPRICLCTGLCDAPWFRIERAARKPPELGHLDGPERLEGAWPWEEMEQQLIRCDRPVRSSDDAGRYVCESTYWALLAFRLRFGYPEYAAFLHVPPVSQTFPVQLTAAAMKRVLESRLAATRIPKNEWLSAALPGDVSRCRRG